MSPDGLATLRPGGACMGEGQYAGVSLSLHQLRLHITSLHESTLSVLFLGRLHGYWAVIAVMS